MTWFAQKSKQQQTLHGYQICTPKQKQTYHALLSALLAVSALDVEHKQVASLAAIDPDAFSCLLAATGFVHDLESGLEQQVQKGTFTRALAANDCDNAIVCSNVVHAAGLEPVAEVPAAHPHHS